MRRANQTAMRAMVYRGPYKVRVEEKDVPTIEHPNDAIVRVTRAAICGSDLHLYHGLIPDTRVRTYMTPGPHHAVRKPSWTGSGPGVTGDCLGFAGTTHRLPLWPSEINVRWC